jgi:plasmid maintenance system killer protein
MARVLPCVTHNVLRYKFPIYDRELSGFRDGDGLGGTAQPSASFGHSRYRAKKLRLINSARRLEDLRVPPGNRLEPLRGGRRGQHSIHINEQWRICFVWKDNNAHEVEIVDYH